MKKILSVLLTAILVFGGITCFAAETTESKINRLKPFELLDMTDEAKTVTRAEAVKALVKLETGKEGVNVLGTVFYDVSSDLPEAGYIEYAYRVGYISGVDETHFAPNAPITLEQFTKVAVSVLGYGYVAERKGYPEGYNGVGASIGLFNGVTAAMGDILTVGNAIILLDNILDIRPMEYSVNGDEYEKAEKTVYERLKEQYEVEEYKGIIKAVGKYTLGGASELSKGRILVGKKLFSYSVEDEKALLGKNAVVRYKAENDDVLPEVITLYEEKNEELVINAENILSFSASKIEYIDEETEKNTEEEITGAEIVYNGSVKTLDISKPKTGTVRCLDNDNDGRFEVVFVDEYESFIIDRTAEVNSTVYFKNDENFRGKTGIKLDFDDRDKEISLKSANGEEIEFSQIKAGMALSIYANEAESLLNVIVSDVTVEGKITAIDFGNEEIEIEGQKFKIYPPAVNKVVSGYKTGENGTFVLNHKNELVGAMGELFSNRLYGYVAGVQAGKALKAPRVKLITAGTREKIIETENGEETITYTYTNGESIVLEFADNVVCTEGGVEVKRAAKEMTSALLDRTVIYYRVNSENKINNIEIFNVPVYETAKLPGYYAYNFNGELNSFGGYISKDAFYVGEATQVICIPISDSPDDDDYGVDVTISDESSCTVMPLNIDDTDQIAACAILYETMNASEQKPLKSTDKVAIVGSVSVSIDKEGQECYNLETLSGAKLDHPWALSGSNCESVVKNLQCGDLIRYNKKTNGEIAGIEYLESLSALGNRYYISREGSETEAVFGFVNSVSLNRLDNLRNEKVDRIVLDINGRLKNYVSPIEDGPTVYYYERKTGAIRLAVTDEINSFEQVGEDASDVFMFVNQNEPAVIVVLN